MKKLVAIMLVGLFLGMGTANAVEVANTSSVAKVGTFNQADMEALFGKDAKNVDVVALDEREMSETKGEAWFAVATVVGGICYLAGCRIDIGR